MRKDFEQKREMLMKAFPGLSMKESERLLGIMAVQVKESFQIGFLAGTAHSDERFFNKPRFEAITGSVKNALKARIIHPEPLSILYAKDSGFIP